ncbi:MAG TPA: type III effector, partial [Gemmobacter sp.]|nr:type III effector [Gemmobacter sp.]
MAALDRGASPLIHTAAGPDDPAVAELRRAVAISGQSMDAVNHLIGSALGRVLDAILT